MKIALFGGTGGVGLEIARQAIDAGHSVRALTRRSNGALPARVQTIPGDILDPAAVAEAIDGAEAVLSCLGARLWATKSARGRIAGPGTRVIIEAMRSRGVSRLVAVSMYGAGSSWSQVGFGARLLLASLMRGELADKNDLEAAVRESRLQWTIVRPVNLANGVLTGRAGVVKNRQVGLFDGVPRSEVARFMLRAAQDRALAGQALLFGGVKDIGREVR